jgi:hypothetical protein
MSRKPLKGAMECRPRRQPWGKRPNKTSKPRKGRQTLTFEWYSSLSVCRPLRGSLILYIRLFPRLTPWATAAPSRGLLGDNLASPPD